jgi:effector-binding domain-containing protein
MPYECEVMMQTAQPTLSVRTRTTVQDLPHVLGSAYRAIAQYLGELGEQPVGPPFAAYYNMDMQDLDVEAGFPVSKELAARDDIKPGEIPSGKIATCLYTGPYSDIEPAYKELFQWIEDNGYEATGVAYEMYLNDPAQTPPEEWKTQVILRLK